MVSVALSGRETSIPRRRNPSTAGCTPAGSIRPPRPRARRRRRAGRPTKSAHQLESRRHLCGRPHLRVMPEPKIMPIPEGAIDIPLLGGWRSPPRKISGDQAAKLRKRKTSAQPSVLVTEKSFRPRSEGVDLSALARQLDSLKQAMRSEAQDTNDLEAVAAISAAADAAKQSPDVLLIGSKQRHGFGEQLLHALSPRPPLTTHLPEWHHRLRPHEGNTDPLPETKARLRPRQRRRRRAGAKSNVAWRPCLAALHHPASVSYFLGRVPRSNRM